MTQMFQFDVAAGGKVTVTIEGEAPKPDPIPDPTDPPPPPPPPPETKGWLGTNLAACTDWGTEHHFGNLFKSARPWFSGTASTWQDSEPLDLDENGWVKSLRPGQQAKTLLLWSEKAEAVPKAGEQYDLYWEGDGDFDVKLGFAVTAREKNRLVVTKLPNIYGAHIVMTRANPANYPRNLSFHRSGAVITPWSETFLKSIEGYSPLRLMDLQATNNSTITSMATRPRIDNAMWSLKGVPLAMLCSLAEKTTASLWFCVPHLADDDLVNEMARLLRDWLPSEARFYLEFSNEVWNFTFQQAQYALQKQREQRLSEDDNYGRLFWYSKRAVQVFKIFEEVFGGTERFTRVMATQSAWPDTARWALSYQDAFENCDALAIAPYFGHELGHEKAQEVQYWSASQVFNYLRTVSLPAVRQEILANKKTADEFGVRLIAYEGGQHLVGVLGNENNERLTALFHEVNRSPEMEGLYTEYLKLWRESGGEEFCHFTSTGRYDKWGSWGSREYLGQPVSETPKARALAEVLKGESL